MFSQSLTKCFFVLETNQSLQNSVSQGASLHTEAWKLTVDTTFNHCWSLWALWPMRSPGQYKPSPPSLCWLFLLNPPRGEVWLSISPLFLLNLNGGEVQLSSSTSQGNFFPTQSLPKKFSTRAASHSRTTKTGATTQQDDFTGLRTAQQPFSSFHGRVTQLGLIIILD